MNARSLRWRLHSLTAAVTLVIVSMIASTCNAQTEPETVVGVEVTGNRNISRQKVLSMIRTRAGRPMDMTTIAEDAKVLARSGQFVDVRPRWRPAPGGAVVVFEVIERPLLHYVKYLGNDGLMHKDKKLAKETGLKEGDPLSPHAVAEGRRKIEAYYLERGYNDVRVDILEGMRGSDRGAVFRISEGSPQRVYWTSFVGNTIASDARLRTQIQSKPGYFWYFKGAVSRKKIDEDVDRLTAYYRSLGYFRAKVDPELEFNDDRTWLSLTYYISEGPRYKIRSVAFAGNRKLSTEELNADLKLTAGAQFDQKKLHRDLATIRDQYGIRGYIFADVQADPRFLEGPEGELDLVYDIAEHKRFRVGKINVRVEGDSPHTRRQVVLNRISLRPGDIIDVRELRASQQRLQRSGLFLVKPQEGIEPRITFSRPENLLDDEESSARRPSRTPGGVRGQSPDDDEVVVDLNVGGVPTWMPQSGARPLPGRPLPPRRGH